MVFAVNYLLPSIGFFAYLTISPFLYEEVIGLSLLNMEDFSLYRRCHSWCRLP